MNITSTFERRYQSIRDGRGVVELLNWSSVVIRGRDRQRFLNSFCTNNVTTLALGESCEAFVTDVKGRIIGHGVVGCREQDLLFVGASNQAARLVEHLDRYIIREDVQVLNTSHEYAYLGATATHPIVPLLTSTAEPISWNLLPPGGRRIFEINANDLAAVRSQLSDVELVSSDDTAFTAARIEAGMPLYGVDFDDRNFPQEVDRDRYAISFTKGCYLGQETVARIDALGHVNQKLVCVRFAAEELPTADLQLEHAGKMVGRVTSAAFSPMLGAPLAFAMVRREANALGTRLTSSYGECEIVAPPWAPAQS